MTKNKSWLDNLIPSSYHPIYKLFFCINIHMQSITTKNSICPIYIHLKPHPDHKNFFNHKNTAIIQENFTHKKKPRITHSHKSFNLDQSCKTRFLHLFYTKTTKYASSYQPHTAVRSRWCDNRMILISPKKKATHKWNILHHFPKQFVIACIDDKLIKKKLAINWLKNTHKTDDDLGKWND